MTSQSPSFLRLILSLKQLFPMQPLLKRKLQNKWVSKKQKLLEAILLYKTIFMTIKIPQLQTLYILSLTCYHDRLVLTKFGRFCWYQYHCCQSCITPKLVVVMVNDQCWIHLNAQDITLPLWMLSGLFEKPLSKWVGGTNACKFRPFSLKTVINLQ